MNGAYFGPFRQALARDFSFRRVHVYDARDDAFSGDGVLQENVIFRGSPVTRYFHIFARKRERPSHFLSRSDLAASQILRRT